MTLHWIYSTVLQLKNPFSVPAWNPYSSTSRVKLELFCTSILQTHWWHSVFILIWKQLKNKTSVSLWRSTANKEKIYLETYLYPLHYELCHKSQVYPHLQRQNDSHTRSSFLEKKKSLRENSICILNENPSLICQFLADFGSAYIFHYFWNKLFIRKKFAYVYRNKLPLSLLPTENPEVQLQEMVRWRREFYAMKGTCTASH